MKYFMNKLGNKYTIIKRASKIIDHDAVVGTIKCGNIQSVADIEAPYAKLAINFLEEKGNRAGHKLLLVTDNRTMAMKTAMMMAIYDADECSDDDMWNCYDDYDEDNELLNLGEVIDFDFSLYGSVDKKDMFYRSMVAKCNFSDIKDILFSNLKIRSELAGMVNAIGCSDKHNQYVMIEPDMLMLPVIQRLIYEYDFEILMLPDIGAGYYEEVLHYLLKDSDYTLAEDIKDKELLYKLSKKRGELMCEEDIAILLDTGVREAKRVGDRTELMLKDFADLIVVNDRSAWDRLKELKGLANVKETVEELVAYAKEQRVNSRLRLGHNHLLFYGKPGTGKTSCAKLLAELFAEEGVGNGSFVIATRNDLIGEYVGHTAPRVAKCFTEAKGGILFVDEAGFLLQGDSGAFVDEAVKEFVRYMEEDTGVTVIFAMYPKEAEAFMDMDAGLRSRIKTFVEFEEYSVKELVDIAVYMFRENGYKLKADCTSEMERYIREEKSREKENFGNARTVRNLVEASITQVSLRHLRKKGSNPQMYVTAKDVKKAELKLQGIRQEAPITFGFCYEEKVSI